MLLARTLLRRYPARFLLLCLTSVLGTVATSALLWSVRAAVDHMATPVPAGVLFGVLLAGKIGLDVAVRTQLAGLGARTLADLRLDLARRAARAPLEEMEAGGTTQLESTFGEEVAAIAQGARALAEMMAAGTLVVGALAFVCATAGVYGPPIVVVVLGAMWALRRISGRAEAYFAQAMPLRAHMVQTAGLVFRGVRELKLHAGRRRGIVAAFDRAASTFHETMLKAATLFGIIDSSTVLLFLLLAAGVSFGLGPVLGSRTPILIMGLLFLQGAFDTIMYELQTVAIAGVVLAEARAMSFAQDDDGPDERAREIDLRGVTRAYAAEDGRPFLLGPVDLALRPGQVVFVVGGNGSGKSTLAKVLMGLYVAGEGHVLLDGAERDRGLAAPILRRSFGAVFAESYVPRRLWAIPSDTIAKRAEPLLAELGLAEKVRMEGNGFSQLGLSSGQRKRLALVVAMLRDRPLYVFDEWTAEQDPTWRAWFYEQFLPRVRSEGKGVVVVTHDDAYFHHADRIVRLQDGRVVEGGTS